MKKVMNVSIETGYLIDVSNLSDSQIKDIEESLSDNKLTVDEISEKYNLKPEDTHHEAIVTVDEG
jgi:hypothetical protein